MQARSIFVQPWSTIGAIVCVLVGAVATHPAHGDDDVTFLKQRVFRIPIEIASEKDQAIRELRLFVSSDRGSTWTRVATVPPSQRSFTFRARVDGEYWFGLAYVDMAGNVEPSEMTAQQAGLKVVVDTAGPVVQLRPSPRSNETAGVEWRLLDDQPVEIGSLRMEYRDRREGTWKELFPEKMIEGMIDWSANPAQSFVVRATVEDKAGNIGSMEVEIPAVDAPAAEPAHPAPVDNTSGPVGSADTFVVPDRPVLSSAPSPAPPAPVPAAPIAATQPSMPMAAESRPIPRPDTPAPTPSYTVAKPAYDPVVETRMPSAEPTPAPVAGPPRDVVASTAVPVRQLRHTTRKPAEPAPPVKRIPLVGSTRFAVDYALRGIGPAGVGRVEMFYTKDNGVSWHLLGEDPDRTPPFEVDLPGEGRYGLGVVVTSPAGNGQRPPQAGDEPLIQVEVDTTAPEAELMRPVPDPQSPHEALLIGWSARDAHLSDRPVRLSYAVSPDGPWETISTDLPPEGQYRWQVPPRTPSEVFLKLSVVDMCNNEAATTPVPVLVDLSQPEAEVIGIAILPEPETVR